MTEAGECRDTSLKINVILTYVSNSESEQRLRVEVDIDVFQQTRNKKLSETEFESLKTEQGIIIDFNNFPSKVINLLEKCSGNGDNSRYHCMLKKQGVKNYMSVIETNDFKQMAHISLCFMQGDDSNVKQLLANRLSQSKNTTNILDTSITLLRKEMENVQLQFNESKESWEKEKTLFKLTLTQNESVYNETINKLHHDFNKQVTSLNEEHARTLEEAKQNLLSQAGNYESIISSIRSDLSKCESKLALAEDQIHKREIEVKRLISKQENLVSQVELANKSVREAELTESKLSESLLKFEKTDNQLQALRELLAEKNEQLHESESKSKHLNKELRTMSTYNEEHKLKIRDVYDDLQSSKLIIEQLNVNVDSLKHKADGDRRHILKLEKELACKETLFQEVLTNLSMAKDGMEKKSEQVDLLREHNKELKLKLLGCINYLQNNESIISRLHKQASTVQCYDDLSNIQTKQNGQSLNPNKNELASGSGIPSKKQSCIHSDGEITNPTKSSLTKGKVLPLSVSQLDGHLNIEASNLPAVPKEFFTNSFALDTPKVESNRSSGLGQINASSTPVHYNQPLLHSKTLRNANASLVTTETEQLTLNASTAQFFAAEVHNSASWPYTPLLADDRKQHKFKSEAGRKLLMENSPALP